MSNVNMHTCSKAAAGWKNDGVCIQCEVEARTSEFFRQFPLQAPNPVSGLIAIGAEKQGIKHSPVASNEGVEAIAKKHLDIVTYTGSTIATDTDRMVNACREFAATETARADRAEAALSDKSMGQHVTDACTYMINLSVVEDLQAQLKSLQTQAERMDKFKNKAWERLIQTAELINRGKGTWPNSDYVRDETWAMWKGEYNALKSSFYALYPGYVELDEAINKALTLQPNEEAK